MNRIVCWWRAIRPSRPVVAPSPRPRVIRRAVGAKAAVGTKVLVCAVVGAPLALLPPVAVLLWPDPAPPPSSGLADLPPAVWNELLGAAASPAPPVPVAEPSGLLLMLSGLGFLVCVAGLRRLRRARAEARREKAQRALMHHAPILVGGWTRPAPPRCPAPRGWDDLTNVR